MTEDRLDLLDLVESCVDEEEAVEVAGDAIASDSESVSILFGHEIGADDPETWSLRDNPDRKDAFEAFCRSLAREEVETFMESVANDFVVEDGRLVVWRAIDVPASWTPADLTSQPLGIFWTFDPDYAEAHWGRGSDTVSVVLEGVVDPENVDWQRTVEVAGEARHTCGEEREIRMLATAEIEVRAVWKKKCRSSLPLMAPVVHLAFSETGKAPSPAYG